MPKRTIQSDSDSSEDSEDEKPLIKRQKVDDTATPMAIDPALMPPAPAVASTATKPNSKKRPSPSASSSDDSSDDEPIAKNGASTSNGKGKPVSRPKRASASSANGKKTKVKKEESDAESSSEADDESEDSDVPLAKKGKAANGKAKAKGKAAADTAAKGKAKTNGAAKGKASTTNGTASKKAKPDPGAAPPGADIKPKVTVTGADHGFASATASPAGTPAKKGKKAVKGAKGKAKKEEGDEGMGEGEEDEDEKHEWWLAMQEGAMGDGSKKWTNLEHAGVLLAPPYVPLPRNVRMKYNGKPVDLPPEAEEVAGFFGAMLDSDHVKNPKFVANFFNDFKKILKQHPPTDKTSITTFEKCDFTPMFDHFQIEKEKKKAMTKDEKKAAKALKDELEEAYKFCKLDGRKEKVGNFRVEPPGLFRGRGDHPKTGMLKTRVMPEQITINIGPNATVPQPPPGHSWEKVIHNDEVTWLATWKENINDNTKYVFLAAGSSLKGQSDMKKFEKARTLKGHIDAIRKDYTGELTEKAMAIRQRATAMYLIDKYALRAGNEKGDDEADTVGCCSLRCEHITLEEGNIVIFDFLGKDSIRFYKRCEVDTQVHKNLRIFKKDKSGLDALFDRLSTTILNKHLTSYMQGLTAKVFRTYNASWTFERELAKTDPNMTMADKVLAYNRANREVALLCNHQRSVSKGHSASMEKLADKLRALKYQRRKLRLALFTLDSKNKKKHKEYADDESDMDDDWMIQHEADLVSKEREKITKKFEKESAKAVENNEAPLDESKLDERLKAADELEKALKKERKTGKVEAGGSLGPRAAASEEKVLEALGKIDERIQNQRTVAVDKEEGKDTALSTSKINYLDPRITYAWCAKHEVPIEKFFSKTLRDKFTWAAVVDGDWTF